MKWLSFDWWKGLLTAVPVIGPIVNSYYLATDAVTLIRGGSATAGSDAAKAQEERPSWIARLLRTIVTIIAVLITAMIIFGLIKAFFYLKNLFKK